MSFKKYFIKEHNLMIESIKERHKENYEGIDHYIAHLDNFLAWSFEQENWEEYVAEDIISNTSLHKRMIYYIDSHWGKKFEIVSFNSDTVERFIWTTKQLVPDDYYLGRLYSLRELIGEYAGKSQIIKEPDLFFKPIFKYKNGICKELTKTELDISYGIAFGDYSAYGNLKLGHAAH